MTAPSIRPGLVSVSLRKLSAEHVIELAAKAGLAAIEWGGDIHVPHGDTATARRIGIATHGAGLQVSAYGSYYRVGVAAPPDWSAVLDSAAALETKSIRVWAGNVGSAAASDAFRREVEIDLAAIADQAASRVISVSLEFHGNTLTDTLDSTLALLRAVGHPNVKSYWQPRHGVSVETNVAELTALRPHLGDLHVFHWWPDTASRLPLAEGVDRWRAFLTAADDGQPRYAMLEFLRNDDPAQLLEDAATLKSLLKGVES